MLCLVRTKACARCGGDLSIECDIYGTYIYCIQCGGNWNSHDLISAHAQATKKEHNRRKAEPAEKLVITTSRR
jgi:hypothetical protein